MTDQQRPRGTRDFNPEEMEFRREVEARMRKAISSFGYREIATPTFEHSALFIARSGPQVVDQMYVFKDKGGRELALRPELTAPAMRFFSSDLRNRPKPLRIFYFGNCFRYERPQKGRYREFWQMGLEYIGRITPAANAEVISASIAALKEAGLKDFNLRVGHVGLLRSVLRRSGIDPDKNRDIMVSIDKKDTEALAFSLSSIEGKDHDELAGLITNTYSLEEAENALEKLDLNVEPNKKDTEELLEVISYLWVLDKNISFDPSISRGLDYYDGIVFEIDVPSLGAESQICGGGAYSLTSVFGREVEGIGFGLGFDRVMVALGDISIAEKEGNRFYVHPMGNEAQRKAFEISAVARTNGAVCIQGVTGRSMKKSINYALNQKCTHMIIIGEKEMEKGMISLKDLRTQKQNMVPFNELDDIL